MLDVVAKPEEILREVSTVDHTAKAPVPAVFDEVNIINSKNVRIGNKSVFNSHVTISQIVHPGAYENDVVLEDEGEVSETPVRHVKRLDSHVEVKEWQKLYVVTFSITMLLVLVACVAIVHVVVKNQNDYQQLFDNETEYPSGKGVVFVKRNEWKARPPIDVFTTQTLPLRKVIIAHTATPFCFNKNECEDLTNLMQKIHVTSLHYIDIMFNFLIGGDGLVYVGRGWRVMGEHTDKHNRESVCIALIGTFTTGKPTEKQILTTKRLIELGVNITTISPDYSLYSHCQLKADKSPGKYVYMIVSKWPHYAHSIDLYPCDNLLTES